MEEQGVERVLSGRKRTEPLGEPVLRFSALTDLQLIVQERRACAVDYLRREGSTQTSQYKRPKNFMQFYMFHILCQKNYGDKGIQLWPP